MEIVTHIICRCADEKQRDAIARYMDRTQRPDFGDEVEEGEEKYFDALEYTEYAHSIERLGRHGLELFFDLSIDPNDDLPDLLFELNQAGVVEFVAHAESDEGGNYYYTIEGGKVSLIPRGGKKRYNDFYRKLKGS